MPTISGTVYDDVGAPAAGRTVRVYRRDTGALLGSATTNSTATAADSNFASVSLLLHADGSNGSTTFTDSSSSPKTVTGQGGAQISTADSKFGGASLSLNGSNAYLSVAASTSLEFPGDMTVELFFKTSATTQQTVLDRRVANGFSSGDWTLFVDGSASGSLILYNAAASTSTPFMTYTGANSADGAWHHIAISRSGSTTYLFRDGVLVNSTAAAATFTSSANPLLIGARNVSGSLLPFNGFIDEVRITKGVGRYTASFTPPSAAFPNTSVSVGVGQYSIDTAGFAGECDVLFLDDVAGITYNDIVVRATPV